MTTLKERINELRGLSNDLIREEDTNRAYQIICQLEGIIEIMREALEGITNDAYLPKVTAFTALEKANKILGNNND